MSSLPETLAADSQLAPSFEEYLVCKVYLDVLEQDSKPETSTMRSVVRAQIKSICRRLIAAADSRYPGLNADVIGRAADLILMRQPIGRDYYLSMLPG